MAEGSPAASTPGPRRWLLVVLAAVILLAVAAVVAINVFGADMGEACADSYGCRGFLVGGAECLDDEGDPYCTVYCDSDAECPDGWACVSATPTAFTVETSAVDEVCVRERARHRGL